MAADPTEIPAVRCQGLVKRFEDVVAVAGIDLEVRRGECMGLLGPNGAGKTTTVELLEGLGRPDAGSVELLGLSWGTGHDQELRSRIGIQLQETQLAERLTVAETIRLFRSFYDRGRTEQEVLALLGLQAKADARVHKLSGGLRQRLALACALVSDPDLLFLDEPTTGLDPQARIRIWEVVEAYRARGGTVLLTTHYMEEAARLCDRVAILDSGLAIALGSPAELIAALDADQIVELRLDGQAAEGVLLGLPQVSRVSRRNDAWVLAVRDIGAVLPALLDRLGTAGLAITSLATRQPTLEDVFVDLTGRGLRDG